MLDEFDGVNPQENRQELTRQRNRALKRARIFRKLFASREGRAALEYLRQTYVLQTRFNPYERAEDCYKWGMYHEGQASVVNHIENLINYTGEKQNG